MIKFIYSIILVVFLFIEGCNHINLSYDQENRNVAKHNIIIKVKANSTVSALDKQNFYSIFNINIINNCEDTLLLKPSQFIFMFVTDSLIFKSKLFDSEIDSIINPLENKKLEIETLTRIPDTLSKEQKRKHRLYCNFNSIKISNLYISCSPIKLYPIQNKEFKKFIKGKQ
jgi:hypothetical protein